MERAGLHMMFYYYSACLHLGKTKENFGIVRVIQRGFFNSEYSPYLLPMFSFKKRRSMHVSNQVTNFTSI
jgi:hypothetical protein